MYKRIIIFLTLMFSLVGYINFFEWYLSDTKIFVEDALVLSLYASVPAYIVIILIHIFYYPTNKDDHAGVITFPPIIWLFSINTGFSIATLNMYYYQLYQIPRFLDFLRTSEIGLFFLVLAISLIIPAIKKFNSQHEDPNPTSPSTLIIKSGIYKYSRNPMYLGLIFLQLSLGILLSMVHIMLMCIFTYIVFKYYVIKPEEKYLSSKFGDDYNDYKSKVRRWI